MTQGFDLRAGRLMITSALEELCATASGTRQAAACSLESGHQPDADLIELGSFFD
jgi:hypothetical protein